MFSKIEPSVPEKKTPLLLQFGLVSFPDHSKIFLHGYLTKPWTGNETMFCQ